MVSKLSETGGWVNGITHHNSPNQGSGMVIPSGVLGVVMHTMVGNLPGTDTVFMDPSYQASAHFGIAQDGTTYQWVNVRGGVAWHVMDGNFNWYGIEHADNGNPGNPLTDAQLSASAQLVELLSRDNVGRFPLQVCNTVSGLGYGTHRMGGAAWGGHSCPQLADGSGPRAGQRAEIISRANIIRTYGQYPAPGGNMTDLGGIIVGSTAAIRFDVPGVTVVAGVGADGRIWARRYAGSWAAWQPVTPDAANGAPSFTQVDDDTARMRYARASDGHVMEMTSNDAGLTWS